MNIKKYIRLLSTMFLSYKYFETKEQREEILKYVLGENKK